MRINKVGIAKATEILKESIRAIARTEVAPLAALDGRILAGPMPGVGQAGAQVTPWKVGMLALQDVTSAKILARPMVVAIPVGMDERGMAASIALLRRCGCEAMTTKMIAAEKESVMEAIFRTSTADMSIVMCEAKEMQAFIDALADLGEVLFECNLSAERRVVFGRAGSLPVMGVSGRRGLSVIATYLMSSAACHLAGRDLSDHERILVLGNDVPGEESGEVLLPITVEGGAAITLPEVGPFPASADGYIISADARGGLKEGSRVRAFLF